MALQYAFIWTQWTTNGEGANVPKVVEDYPHAMDYDTWDRAGSLVAYEDQVTSLIRWGWRAIPTHVITEGIRMWQDETGSANIPPLPNVLMGRACAEAQVFTDMAQTFLDAEDKSGLSIPVWREHVDPDDGATGFDPDDPFIQAEINALSDWINANGITNQQFANYFGVTPAEVADWMKSHSRQQFTNIVAAEWAELTGA